MVWETGASASCLPPRERAMRSSALPSGVNSSTNARSAVNCSNTASMTLSSTGSQLLHLEQRARHLGQRLEHALAGA